ncbi:MAG TPA: YwiC-like family protein [Anaeromyxobacteraceae bacterium]|nr:YwiC-like family protein [Anaeromyxobacteraceae bacterium]
MDTTTPAPVPSSGSPAAAPPALVPREHGAYGQLAMPILSGLALGRPGAAAFALAAAFVLAFVAHEPLLVLLGQRGTRMRTQEGARAARLLAALGALVAASAAAGVALAPQAARAALALPAGLGAAVAVLLWRRLEKTAPGEILVAAALSSCGAVVALAGGATHLGAWTLFVTWVLAFTAAIVSVRSVLRLMRTRGTSDRRPLAAALVVLLLAGAFLLAARTGLPLAAPVALMPMAVAAVVLCVVQVPPRRLQAAGWAIVGASTATLVLLVAGLR